MGRFRFSVPYWFHLSSYIYMYALHTLLFYFFRFFVFLLFPFFFKYMLILHETYIPGRRQFHVMNENMKNYLNNVLFLRIYFGSRLYTCICIRYAMDEHSSMPGDNEISSILFFFLLFGNGHREWLNDAQER